MIGRTVGLWMKHIDSFGGAPERRIQASANGMEPENAYRP